MAAKSQDASFDYRLRDDIDAEIQVEEVHTSLRQSNMMIRRLIIFCCVGLSVTTVAWRLHPQFQILPAASQLDERSVPTHAPTPAPAGNSSLLQTVGGWAGILAALSSGGACIASRQTKARLEDMKTHLAQLKITPENDQVRKDAIECYNAFGTGRTGCFADMAMSWQNKQLIRVKDETEGILSWDPNVSVAEAAEQKLSQYEGFEKVAMRQEAAHMKANDLGHFAHYSGHTDLVYACLQKDKVSEFVHNFIDVAIKEKALGEAKRASTESRVNMMLLAESHFEEVTDFHINWDLGGTKFVTYFLLGSSSVPFTDQKYVLLGYSFKDIKTTENYKWNEDCRLNDEGLSLAWCQHGVYQRIQQFKRQRRLPALQKRKLK